MIGQRQSVPPLALVLGALRLLWAQRDDALRLGIVPTLILFAGFNFTAREVATHLEALGTGAPATMSGDVIMKFAMFTLIFGVAATVLVTNWLRFVLLGPMSAVGMGLTIGKPHAGFFISMAGLILGSSFVLFLLTMPVAILPPPLSGLAFIGLMIAIAVVLARLVMGPVSIAIGQNIGFAESWRATQGNGIRIAFAIVLAQIPFVLAIRLLIAILDSFGFPEAAPLATIFIAAVFQAAVLMTQAGVLAAAYRQLIGIEV